jgi:two-component system sensor histidine kinase AlgZ
VPDFGNLGVLLRALLLVNGLALLPALARNDDWQRLPQELVALAALVEPPLLGTLLLVLLLRRPLQALPRPQAWLLVAAIGAGCAILFAHALAVGGEPPQPLRVGLWAILASIAVLAYFDARSRAFSPALAEGRLLALTARIRPHFLFNSLNAVLGVMRADPRRAEIALEELADLFRVLMRENRELTTLGEELALCRQYLDLERLRLGERLAVKWQTEHCPEDALVPPLMLQPLLENAVYHGIEPAAGTGEIVIAIGRKGDEILIALTNPYLEEGRHGAGNRMALNNIRERLMLFFDLEARLDTAIVGGEYRVRIRLPYRTREAA